MEAIGTVCKLIHPNDFLTSLDLQDAFLHVVIQKSSRQFLQFKWQDRLFQFKVLPFGLSLSPWVFTKVLKPFLKWARRQGIRISAYLDDLIVIAKDYQTSQLHTSKVAIKLRELGFLIHPSKSQLTPTQVIEHLGFTINTQTMSVSVPRAKVRDIRREASRMLRSTQCTLRQLAAFIGKAQATTMAIFPARLMTRQLLAVKNQMLRTGKPWSSTVHLPAPALQNLRWWITHLQSWNGQSFLPSLPEAEVYTDACDDGWGIVYGSTTVRGSWPPEQHSKHINWKELMAIFHTIQLPQLQGKSLHILCDNMTTIAYVNHFGGSRSPTLMDLADQIWRHCLATGTRLHLSYVPSAMNPADPPSRQWRPNWNGGCPARSSTRSIDCGVPTQWICLPPRRTINYRIS